ncbi:MAG: cytochrome c biogenesis protein ResB [bacterium]
MVKKIVRFFSSLKLTISLLIILALTSIIGTVIQQQQNPAIYLQQFGKPVYQVFKVFGFFDLYHSWWFMALLALLTLNLLFCSLRRLPRDLQLILSPRVKITDNELKALSSQEKLLVKKQSLDQTLEAVLAGLKKSGFGCRHKVKNETGWYLFSERGKFSRLAFHITHLSIILIFAGAIIGAARGFKGFINIVEGQKGKVITLQSGGHGPKELDFEVECRKFEVTYYQDESGNLTNRPKDYKSLLVIHDHGKEVFAKEIEVNAPLNYQGIYFYQSSFGEVPQLTVTVKTMEGEPIGNFDVQEGGSFHFSGKDGQKTQVTLLRYFPDFYMNQNGQVDSRSNVPNNPAAFLEIRTANDQPRQTWVFHRFPDFPHGGQTDYKYSLISVDSGKKYTGLQVVWDPGVPLVWTGCIILVMGIIIIFSVPHYRLWVVVTDKGNSQEITIAGSTNKNKPSFQAVFAKIVTNLGSNLTDRTTVG